MRQRRKKAHARAASPWLRRSVVALCAIVAVVVAASLVLFTSPGRALGRRLPVVSGIIRWMYGGPVMPEAHTYGIDVSRYQGEIDWEKLRVIPYDPITRRQDRNATGAEVNIGFIFAKASEGADHVDPNIDINREGARGLSIPFGAYHVLTMADARAQAQNFIKTAKLQRGDLTPVIDVEDGILGGLETKAVRNKILGVAKQLEKEYGRKPIIYSSVKLLEQLNDGEKLAGYAFWIARYQVKDRPERADIWQFTESGLVPGIRSMVDLNALYTDRFRLSDYVLRR